MENQPLQSVDTALSLKPGFELDVYIYRYIFDGILEVASSAQGQKLARPIPSFSRRADAAKMILVKMAMEHRDKSFIVTFMGDEGWDHAKKAGHIMTDAPVPVWLISIGRVAGYGRTYEEAICKLAVMVKSMEDAGAVIF